MSSLQTTTLFTLCLLALLAVGLAVFLFKSLWGFKFYKSGRWPIGGMFVVLIGVALFGSFEFLENGHQVQTLNRGWIFPRHEIGAITVGILLDPLALTMTALVATIAFIMLASRSFFSKEAHCEESALAISTAGVILAWVAMTPWLAFLALVFVIFAGFVALGSKRNSDQDSDIATRFGWERCWGLAFIVLGAAILAGTRTMLNWDHWVHFAEHGENSSGVWLASSALQHRSDLIGAGFLLIGLFIQLQIFPFMGWVGRRYENSFPLQIVLSQIFPAWVVFALLIRLEQPFRSIGVFPLFAWIPLVAGAMTLGTSLLQMQGRVGVSGWIAAGFSIAFAALASIGVSSAFYILLGVSLGGIAFSIAVFAMAGGGRNEQNRSIGWLIICFLAVAAGTGMLGFVSSGGFISWIAGATSSPLVQGFFVLVYFLLVLQGWKLAWMCVWLKEEEAGSWYSILGPLFLVFFALGVCWTGTLTGGALFGNPDTLFSSLSSMLFGVSVQPATGQFAVGENEMVSSFWLSFGVQLIGFLAAYWTSGRKHHFWGNLTQSFPKISGFMVNGYYTEQLGFRLFIGIRWIGDTVEWITGKEIWGRWIPHVLSLGINRGSQWVALVDAKLSQSLNLISLFFVEISAEGLQRIQNGDVQWYLLFALGSGVGIAILTYVWNVF